MELNKNFVDEILEKLVWAEVSKRFTFDEQQLDRYMEDVDWKEISDNRDIRWTTALLGKFKNKIDWEILSSTYDRDNTIFTEAHLEKFKDHWNWAELSRNTYIPFSVDLIDAFAQNWDWDTLITNRSVEQFIDLEFLMKYKHYISAEKLWDSYVEIRKNKIIKEIQKI